jgi:hypothetical protein
MIVSQGKKGLNISSMQLELLLFGDMIVPRGKGQIPKEQCSLPKETYVPIFFVIITISCSFLYFFAT